MSQEFQPISNHEKGFNAPEHTKEQERLREQIEKAAEQSKERGSHEAETARHEIERITAEKEALKHGATPEKTAAERPIRSKASQRAAYAKILKQTQAELSPVSRAFSKVIHNPVIDKVSEAAGNTIARPNAMLSGAVFAFLLTLAVYLIARFNGYPLSGTETIAAFIVGWVIGNLYDFFKVMITGKK